MISTSENEEPTCPRLPALIVLTMVSRNFRERSSMGVVLMGAVFVAIWERGCYRRQAEHVARFFELFGLPDFAIALVHAGELPAHEVRRQKLVQQDEGPFETEQRE